MADPISPIRDLQMESQSQINTSGNKYYYYRCYDTYRTGKCHFKGNINEKYVEQFLIDNIITLFEKTVYELQEQNKKVISKKTDVTKYKEELERLNTMFLKGRIDENTYDKEYKRLQKIIIEHESNKDTSNSFDFDRISNVFSNGWENIYKNLSRQNKRQFWRDVIKEIHFNEDKTVKTVIFL